MSLGSYPIVGLAEARLLASEKRGLITKGIDPLQERQQAKLAAKLSQTTEKTFDWCSQEYIKSKQIGWKNAKHVQQWSNTIKCYVSPFIGSLHVSKIEVEHVLQCLQPIWHEKTETAKRVRGRIESVMAWGTR